MATPRPASKSTLMVAFPSPSPSSSPSPSPTSTSIPLPPPAPLPLAAVSSEEVKSTENSASSSSQLASSDPDATLKAVTKTHIIEEVKEVVEWMGLAKESKEDAAPWTIIYYEGSKGTQAAGVLFQAQYEAMRRAPAGGFSDKIVCLNAADFERIKKQLKEGKEEDPYITSDGKTIPLKGARIILPICYESSKNLTGTNAIGVANAFRAKKVASIQVYLGRGESRVVNEKDKKADHDKKQKARDFWVKQNQRLLSKEPEEKKLQSQKLKKGQTSPRPPLPEVSESKETFIPVTILTREELEQTPEFKAADKSVLDFLADPRFVDVIEDDVTARVRYIKRSKGGEKGSHSPTSGSPTLTSSPATTPAIGSSTTSVLKELHLEDSKGGRDETVDCIIAGVTAGISRTLADIVKERHAAGVASRNSSSGECISFAQTAIGVHYDPEMRAIINAFAAFEATVVNALMGTASGVVSSPAGSSPLPQGKKLFANYLRFPLAANAGLSSHTSSAPVSPAVAAPPDEQPSVVKCSA